MIVIKVSTLPILLYEVKEKQNADKRQKVTTHLRIAPLPTFRWLGYTITFFSLGYLYVA